MHEVYKEKKDRGGSVSDFVFLDGEGKRKGEQYRYIGGRRRGGGRINRIFATGLRGCAAIRCWPQTA